MALWCVCAAPSARAQCSFSGASGPFTGIYSDSFIDGTSGALMLPSGGNGTLGITFTASSGCTWSVQWEAWVNGVETVSPSYVTFSGPTSGSNTSTSVTIPVAITSDSDATGRFIEIDITVNGAVQTEWLFYQNGSACAASVNPPSVTVPASGGSYTFTVNSGGCWVFGSSWLPSDSLSSVSWVTNTSITQPNPVSPAGGANATISYTVQANTGVARSTTINFTEPNAGTFTINQLAAAAPLSINCTSLGSLEVAVFYSTTCTASGGTPPYTWRYASTPTSALAVQENGSVGTSMSFSGTPTGSGPYSLPILAVDSGSPAQTQTQTLSGTIFPALLLTTPLPAFPNGAVGVQYNATFDSVSGGTGNYTWSAVSSSLPPGLSLTSNTGPTGAISGVPAANSQGSYAPSFSVTDGLRTFPINYGAGALTISSASGLSSLTPASATVGAGPFTLTLTGTGFTSQSLVLWGGAPLTPSSQTATQLTVTVPGSDLNAAGPVTVQVETGSVTSTGLTFTVNPVPSVSRLNPPSAAAGGPAFSLMVTGSGFTPTSGGTPVSVQWSNGNISIPLNTTFISATQLEVSSVPMNLIATAGTASISVISDGVASNSLPFTITASAAPAISSLNPPSAPAGGAGFPLTVNGSGLTGGTVYWNGSPLVTEASSATQTASSATQITAAVPQNLIATVQPVSVVVLVGGVSSNSLSFTITAPGQTLTISCSPPGPATATLGITFSVTCTASGGTAPYSWSFQPSWLTGPANGATVTWTGTPPSAGPTTISVTVGDSSSPKQQTQTDSITVNVSVPQVQNVTITQNGSGAMANQTNLLVEFPQAAIANYTGTLSLSFTPNPGIKNLPPNYVDPAGGFPVSASSTPACTAGQVCLTENFSVNQGQTQTSLPFGLGTVAGTWTVTLTELSGGIPSSFAPYTVTVSETAPVIVAGSVQFAFNSAGNQVSVQLMGSTSTRGVTSGTFVFTAAANDQLTGNTVTVQFDGLDQTQWFDTSQSDASGGGFSLMVPFGYSGPTSALGSVTVTLTNSAGSSAPVTATQ